MRKFVFINLLVLILIFAGLVIGQRPADAAGFNMQSDQKKADRLVENLPVSEVLGPLAPIALSPYFGLACLSGTSILCNMGILPENSFLMGNDALNNWYVFAAFLALTIITSIPRLMTVSKVFAEIADKLETYAGIISYVVIILLVKSTQTPEQETVVYSAGIFTFTQQSLLACIAILNIYIIATVRFFFELLTLISPIPTLDAIFEFANKTLVALLTLVYAFNPWLAFVLDIIIFLICLIIFKWVKRRIRYLTAILLDPAATAIKRKLFKNYKMDSKACDKLAVYLPDIELLVKCFPKRKLKGIKKKDLCYLVFSSAQLALVKLRFLRPPVIIKLDRSQVTTEIKEGLISFSIEITDDSGRKSFDLVFGRAYRPLLSDIKSKLRDKKSP